MEINIITAYSNNRVIGNNNKIPWSLAGDLKHFKETTLQKPIIMGRKTWESLNIKPLPHRKNIVITTRNQLFTGAISSNSLSDAIKKCGKTENIFIIGGEQIYSQFIPFASKIIATEIFADFPGDSFFPELNKNIWVEEKRESKPPENGIHYDIVTYKKIPEGIRTTSNNLCNTSFQ